MKKALIIAKSVIMKAFHIFSFFTLTMCALTAQVLPTDLQFSRLAVRRFVFDNNINLCEFLPSKIVALNGMYPVLGVSENGKPNYVKRDFKDPSGRDFVFENYGDKLCAIGIGGVFPFACYETQINGIKSENGNRFSTGIVIGDNTLRNSVRFFCEKSGQNTSIVFDEFTDGKKTQSRQILKNAPLPPFKLIVQLYGNCAAVFTEKDGKTSYVWHMQKGDFFGKNCDFRIRKTAARAVTVTKVGLSIPACERTAGLTASMYDIATKVAIAPQSSVFTEVLRSDNPKNLSTFLDKKLAI